MRAVFSAILLGVVSACAPQIPESGAGFDNSPDAQRARELELAAGSANVGRLVPGGVISGEVPDQPAVTPAVAPVAQPLPGAATSPASSASAVSGGGADIAALTAAALAAAPPGNGAAPDANAGAVPPRPAGTSSPNIVAYALETSNPRGNRIYSRTGVNLEARSVRNCAAYPSSDQAQIAFLTKGGPENDRLALDPDGDGYACGWDPAPFRKAVQN